MKSPLVSIIIVVLVVFLGYKACTYQTYALPNAYKDLKKADNDRKRFGKPVLIYFDMWGS